MSLHWESTLNFKGSEGSKIHKACHEQEWHHHHRRRHQAVEYRDDASPSSYSSSKRSEHDEENDNICNKNMGTDKTLDVSFCRAGRDKKNNSMIEQEKVDKLPNTITKDVHYYSILARIHKAITSTNNTPSLGSILADANKRGMSLDAVIELYKEERIKVISLQGSCENKLAMSEVHSTVMNEEKEADQNEAPWDCDELGASTFFGGLDEKGQGYDASEGNVDEVSVDHETQTKDLTHHDPTAKALSFDTTSKSSTAQVRCVMESWDESQRDYLGETFPSVSLSHQDDDSENAHLILKVSSEIGEEMEEINRERRPDPPGLSTEDEPHPDPPGLSIEDNRDADSTRQAPKHVFDNCVEVVLEQRSKKAVTGYAQKHILKGSREDAEVGVNAGICETHPDPPGHSYSSTTDSIDMDSASYSSSTTHEHHEVFVCKINSFDSKERANGAAGHDNETSHIDDRRRSSRDNSSTARDFVDDRNCIKNEYSKNAQGKEIAYNDEKSRDTQQPSKSDSDISVPCSSSPTIHEHRDFSNNVEIILKDCSSESEVAEPKANFSIDVGSYHYFNALEALEDNLGVNDVQFMNKFNHNSEDAEGANQLDVSGLASSSSQECNADTDDVNCFTARTSQQRNTIRQYQDICGDGVEDSLEDSVEDEAEMRQHSKAASTQGDNDDEASTLGTESDTTRGECLKNTGGGNGADQELGLGMQQHAAYSTCDKCNDSYFGSSATHEYHDDFDNGIEVVLEESSTDEIAELSCFVHSETCYDASASKPQKEIDNVDITTLDLDNIKLWKATSNDTEEIEDGDETYHSGLLVQASSSTIDSDEKDSHSCSGSSSSEELQDGASHSTSDGFNDDLLELSRIFNQATTLVREAIGVTESDEAAALELSDSKSMNVTVQAHHDEQQKLTCISNASSSCLDNSPLDQKAHELIGAEVSLANSNCDAVDRNEHNQIGSRMAENSEVNAFISRFSIHSDEEPVHVECKERSQCKESAGKAGEKDMMMNERGELKSQGVRRVRNNLINHRLRNNAKLATETTNENLHLSAEVDSYLPNHLGLWKSPWQKTKLPWDRKSDVTPSDTIETIASSECSNQRRFLNVDHRLKGHSGYSNIDFYSLYEASLVKAQEEDIDQAPWECRDVGQRFLHEKSVESRNWFGKFLLLFSCNFQH